MRRLRVSVAAAVATLAIVAAAVAGPPGRWTPISKGALTSKDVPGLARTSDGILHVAWERRGTKVSALWQTRVAMDGALDGSEAIAGGLVGGGSPALTVAADGSLRAFFFVQAADGTGADLRLGVLPRSGGWAIADAALAQVAGAAVPTVSAGTARDGTPVAVWSTGTQIRYRFGVDPGAAGVALAAGGCCATAVRPAIDQTTGQAYVAWASSVPGATGIFVQAVDRAGASGPKVYATGSGTKKRNAAVLPDGRVALAARSGQPGVFVAYTSGFPKVRSIDVLQAGARKLVFTIKAPGAAHIALAPAPQGRLWLAWSRGGTIYATRTNRDASRLGAIRKIPVRRGSVGVKQLEIDGGTGALDLVASLVSRGGAVTLWHEQMLPGLTLAVTATSATGGPKRYVFRVSDAGEPVANATVKVGKQSLTTGLSGTVILSTGDHPPSATAAKLGYASATTPIP